MAVVQVSAWTFDCDTFEEALHKAQYLRCVCDIGRYKGGGKFSVILDWDKDDLRNSHESYAHIEWYASVKFLRPPSYY